MRGSGAARRHNPEHRPCCWRDALLFGALVPWLARGPLLPGTLIEHASVNTLTGNAVAVVIALWMRLSIETYPAFAAAP